MSKPYLSFDLDQIPEKCDISTRHNVDNIPPALQDSPYLSSPIRPIPSFNQTRGGRQGKRSAKQNNRASSPTHSTVASTAISSPYSESLFSLQSSPQFRSKRQSTSRTVLLPQEVDELMRTLEQEDGEDDQECVNLKLKSGNGNVNAECQCNSEEDDDYSDSLSNSDESNTVTSDCALSLNDESVAQRIKEMEVEREVVLFVNDKDKKSRITSRRDESTSVKGITKESKDIKLPPVGTILPETIHSSDINRPNSRKGRENAFNINSAMPGLGSQSKESNTQMKIQKDRDDKFVNEANNGTKRPSLKQKNRTRSSGQPYLEGGFKQRSKKLRETTIDIK